MFRKILKILYRIITGSYLRVFHYLKNRSLRKYYRHKKEQYLVKVMTKLPKNVYFVRKSDKLMRKKSGTWKIEKLPRTEFDESFYCILKGP